MKLSELTAWIVGCLFFLLVTGTGYSQENDNKLQLGDTGKLWAMALTGKIDSEFDRIYKAVNINQPNNKVTVYIKNEWEDIKAFQRQGWHEGQQQLAQNKEQISNIFTKISNFFTGKQ